MKYTHDFFYRLSRWHRYASLYIDGNIPRVQTEYRQVPHQGGFEYCLFLNAPISFQKWLTYPYETREEQEKHLWA